jgi:hypothetical protein
MAIESLEEKVARLEAEKLQLEQKNQSQAEELATAEQTVSDLNEKLSNVEAAEVVHVVVSYKKEQYRVLAQQFDFGGTLVKASELQENKEVLAALVEDGSGLLQKVK